MAVKGSKAWNDAGLMVPCAHCGTEVKRSPSRLKRQARVFCSYSCRSTAHSATLVANRHDPTGKPGKPRYGADNPAWKGGVTHKRRQGNYIHPPMVRCPPHLAAMARSNGYIPLHRLVMAEWVGRPLTRAECVNHIDHDTSNNERSNLELWPTNRDHKLGEYGRFVEGVANSR